MILNYSCYVRSLWCIVTLALTCLIFSLAASAQGLRANPVSNSRNPLDDTGGFIHLAPGVVHTNNECNADFSVSVVATLTDALNFGLRFQVDTANVTLLSITPGADTTLHLLPTLLANDTLHLDGFFHPNFPAGSVTLATLNFRTVALADTVTHIGYLNGQGFSGTGDNPQPIMFAGNTATVIIDGTPPRPPDSLIIIPLAQPATDDSVRLQWHRVTHDIHGNLVTQPLYNVYLHDVLNDTTFKVASVLDTFDYDRFVHFTFPPCTAVVNVGVYEVHACKTRP